MSFAGLRILVVDDNANMRRLVVSILQSVQAGEVRQAESAAQGFAVLQDWRPDLVLVDFVMDGENGAAFTRRVRDGYDRDGERLPVVIISGYADVPRFEEAKAAGANDFIPKPFTPKLLLQRIERVLRDNRTILELEQQARQRVPDEAAG